MEPSPSYSRGDAQPIPEAEEEEPDSRHTADGH